MLSETTGPSDCCHSPLLGSETRVKELPSANDTTNQRINDLGHGLAHVIIPLRIALVQAVHVIMMLGSRQKMLGQSSGRGIAPPDVVERTGDDRRARRRRRCACAMSFGKLSCAAAANHRGFLACAHVRLSSGLSQSGIIRNPPDYIILPDCLSAVLTCTN